MQPIQSTATEVFRFPTLALLIPMLLCVACAVLSAIFFLKPARPKFGSVLLAIAVVAGGIWAPSSNGNRVVISPQAFAVTTGFWFAQTHKGFLYKDVRLVRLRQQNNHPAWQVDYKDGHSELIECTRLWTQNYQAIMEALQKRGISFRNDIVGY